MKDQKPPSIGVEYLSAMGLFSAGISRCFAFDLSENPSDQNLKAMVALIDALLSFEPSFLGLDPAYQNSGTEMLAIFHHNAQKAMSTEDLVERKAILDRTGSEWVKATFFRNKDQFEREIALLSQDQQKAMRKYMQSMLIAEPTDSTEP